MIEQIKIGLTCLITFCIMLVIVIKTYLTIGRRIEADFKKVIGIALRWALSTSVSIITFGSTVINWFCNGETSLGVYLYFLTFLVSLMSAIDSYKVYKRQQYIYQVKCQGRKIVICPKCDREMKMVEKNTDIAIDQELMNNVDIYFCKKCGYIEFYYEK